MSRRQWTDAEVQRATLTAIRDVAKAANCTLKSVDIEYVTPVERAQALSKAFRYDQLARQVIDPIESERYTQLAKAERQKAVA